MTTDDKKIADNTTMTHYTHYHGQSTEGGRGQSGWGDMTLAIRAANEETISRFQL